MPFYDQRRWRDRTRVRQLRREPLCRACRAHGLITAATEVDHIVALRDGGDAHHPSNLQSLCKRHHSMKTNEYDACGRRWDAPPLRVLVAGCDENGKPIVIG